MIRQEIRAVMQEVRLEMPPPPPPVAQPILNPPVEARVEPRAPQGRSVIDEGGVTFFDFIMLNLPEFKGEHGEDPTEFIENVDRVVKLLPCTDDRTIELMGLQLRDDAAKWFVREIDPNIHSDNPMTWEQFKEALLDEYLTEGLKERNLVRFEQLKQGNRSVAEYAEEFCKLSKFATSIAPTEVALVHRFRRGLNASLHNFLLATYFTSLSKLIDKATQMEAKYKEERLERESREGKGGVISIGKVKAAFK